jgi:hypothetical protein
MPIYDATFTTGGPGIDDVLQSPTGNAGLWSSQPAGHWSVSGTTLVGTPAGSAPSFLIRPSAEPAILPIPWGSSQAIVALTPPGGWGSSATAWGLALCWSMPGSDATASSYYLAEIRPGMVTDRPNTLSISKVEAGTSTALGSVAWTNDSTKSYDVVFEGWCECLGRPVYLFASVIDRATPLPTLGDTAHDLTVGGAGVTVLALTDAAPGLSNGLIGCPALVALPGTAGASFVRVQLHNPAPSRTFSGFGQRPIGVGWSIGSGGAIVADPGVLVFPI